MTDKWVMKPNAEGHPFASQLRPLQDLVLHEAIDEAALPLLRGLRNGSFAASSQAFHLVCKPAHLIALSGPAIRTSLTQRRWLSLLYVESGELNLVHPEHSCFGTAGDWLLVPGCPLIWDSSLFRVVCLLISPQQIARSLQLGASAPQQSMHLALPEWPLTVRASQVDGVEVVVWMLTCLLRAASQLHRSDPELLQRLAVGDQFCRLMAVLIGSTSATTAKAGSGQRAAHHVEDPFEELIRYIKTNLDQPLNLTVLAHQSHYSRRALQYAFRDRLGCTATQWIRSQRLDLAQQRLLTARPGETVTQIAQACGYRSLSLFSIEFQQRFHVKPSVLLRRTRGNPNDDGPRRDVSDSSG